MLIDLHVHTLNSDGTDTLDDILKIVKEKHMKGVIGIVDHHTFTFSKSHSDKDVSFISGIEISTEIGSDGFHILAYSNKFTENKRLDDILDRVNEGYNKRAEKIIKKINQRGLNLISRQELSKKYSSSVIYLNHLAEELKYLLNLNSVQDAKKWAKMNGNLLFVSEDKYLPDTEIAIKEIHNSSGLSVWAHPAKNLDGVKVDWKDYLESILNKMVIWGLDGLEVFHPAHTQEVTEFLLETANKKNLLITGGSDYHGESRGSSLGQVTLEKTYFDDFLKKLKLN